MDDTGASRDRAPMPTLVVAYDGAPMSETQLHLACRSANDLGARVRVVHVVERPAQVPLQAPSSADELAEAERLEQRVARIATRYGVQSEFAVVYARSVGTAIIAEAQETNAQAIFVGLRERRRPGTSLLLSGTVRHVLQHARCPVQIGYLPADLPAEFALTDELP